MNKKTLSARALAATTLVEVLDKRNSLTAALAATSSTHLNSSDYGFWQELCYGTTRWYWQLKIFAENLLSKKLAEKDGDIYALLLLGFYQLKFLQTAPHAALHATVEAARELNKPWACNLINAVLRNFQRQQEALEKKVQQTAASQYAHPQWFCNRIEKYWPNESEKILLANNSHPTFTLRVNQQKISRSDYLAKLTQLDIAAELNPLSPEAITLESACDVFKLPGFSDGECSVQDAAAQLAAHLLELQPGQTVLDACAAPGGKTAHILEMQPQLKKLIALDNDEQRLTKIQENLTRLKLQCDVICGDAAQPKKWQGEELFDRILIDAPCSATGVIRRHPDIKILRRAEDIFSLSKQQKNILQALWPLLKPNGILVYATCSVLPEENTQIMESFLAEHSDAREIVIDGNWGKACTVGRQLFPEENGCDGFYYAKVIKEL